MFPRDRQLLGNQQRGLLIRWKGSFVSDGLSHVHRGVFVSDETVAPQVADRLLAEDVQSAFRNTTQRTLSRRLSTTMNICVNGLCSLEARKSIAKFTGISSAQGSFSPKIVKVSVKH